jgi:hypothetical protein
VPLAAGESLAFATLDFPGLGIVGPLGEDDPEWRIEALLDAGRAPFSARERVALDVQITSFEVIGSSVFLQTDMLNFDAGRYTQVFVLAGMYAGPDLISAGWVSIFEALPDFQGGPAVLHLPLPAGFEISEAEFDLRAFGIASEP